MQAALGAVKSGVSVLQVAREHGVPRQTLRDRVSGRWNCHTVLLWDHRLQDCRLALQQQPLREEEATNLDQPSTLTNAVCATEHLRRTNVNALEWVECVCKRWLHEDCVCDMMLTAAESCFVFIVQCDIDQMCYENLCV